MRTQPNNRRVRKDESPRTKLRAVTRAGFFLISIAILGPPSASSRTSADANEPADSVEAILEANTLANFNFGIPDLQKLGDENAPLVLLEFSDYQCDHCAIFHEIVFPVIASEYIDTGKLYYVSLNHPQRGHALAAFAAAVAYCATSNGKFWEMRDRLFSDTLYLTKERIIAAAAGAGLPASVLEDCARKDDIARLIVAERRSGENAGVEITPSFILARKAGTRAVDGTLLEGLIMWTDFRKQIEAKLKNNPATR